jgi:hypothetical protein
MEVVNNFLAAGGLLATSGAIVTDVKFGRQRLTAPPRPSQRLGASAVIRGVSK